uniref:Alcohol dehydrogenase-like C-terminal domain-containing protein n=1 Tax=Zea mays TaxID=4577 RepID=A0A804LUI5_MAIZE
MGKGAQGSDAAAAGGEVEENMAAWLVAKNTLKIMPFKLPPVGPYDVRVRMKAVGICGSDVHYLREMRIAHFVVKEPMVIGHECAGVVEEVERIRAAMGSDIDVSLDCAGFSKTMSTALESTRPGGKVCLVGMGHNEMTLPLTAAAAREVDVKPLITHRFGFSQRDVEEAFEVSARGRDAIKVMFNL